MDQENRKKLLIFVIQIGYLYFDVVGGNSEASNISELANKKIQSLRKIGFGHESLRSEGWPYDLILLHSSQQPSFPSDEYLFFH